MNGEISITSRHFDHSEASGEPKLNEVKLLKMHFSLSQLKDLTPLFMQFSAKIRMTNRTKKYIFQVQKCSKNLTFTINY